MTKPFDPLAEKLLPVSEDDDEQTERTYRPAPRPYQPVFLLCLVLAVLIATYLILGTMPRAQVAKSPDVLGRQHSNSARLPTTTPKFFQRPPGSTDLRCDWVMDGKHADYVKKLAANRRTFEDPDSFDGLPMDCASVRGRHRWPTRPSTDVEAAYPIAQARAVYRDYYYLESVLASTYQPQNWYCYAIDSAADHLFRARLKRLAQCFSNVIVAKKYEKLDSAGHAMDKAHLDCLRELAQAGRNWKYVHLLQNHDVPARTNYEAVHILKNEFRGANDIELNRDPNRIDYKLNWTMQALEVFRNSSRLDRMRRVFYANSTEVPHLSFAKGYNEVTVSRAAVDYIFNELNVAHIVQNMDRKKGFGVDELFFPTILSFEPLDIPGAFTQECIRRGQSTTFVTRFSIWGGSRCRSAHFRHAICIFGVEDLEPNINKVDHFFVNKIMADFDFNAFVCWMEVLHNRTWLEEPSINRLNLEKYRQLPHVRYQSLKDENGFVSSEKKKGFKCKV